MKRNAIRFFPAAALILMLTVLVSCQVTPEPASLSAEENMPISDQPAEQPQTMPERPSKKASNGLEISSNQQQTDANEAASEDGVPPEAEEIDELPSSSDVATQSRKLEHFTLAQPRLMGLTVGDGQEIVAQLHGQPREMSSIADGERKLSVHHYDGFMVGMNAQQKIEFITVMSRHVEPGLNGFHIGHTSVEAMKQLGEPASENEYVLTYQGNGTMLKLDVDPVTGEVLSARLFAEEE